MGEIDLRLKKRITKVVDEHRGEAVKLLKELVQMPSPEGEGRALQEFIATYFGEMGADKVDLWDIDLKEMAKHPGYSPVLPEHSSRPADEKPVCVGLFKGKGGGRSFGFFGHMESGTPAWEPAIVEKMKYDPFKAVVADGKLYGRASYNMKGGNVAAIMAVKLLREMGIRLKGDVFIQTNLDEDTGSNGALAAVLRGYRADGGICPEPTGMWICPATGGPLWFRVIVRGVGGFAGTSRGEANAIDKGIKIYQAIRDFETYRQMTKSHPLFSDLPNQVPLAVGVFRAGNWPSNMPAICTLEGRIGCLPGEDFDGLKKEFESQIDHCAQADPWLRHNPPKVEWMARWEACETDPDHPFVRTVAHAYASIMGEDPVICAKTAGNDMTKFRIYGNVPSVNLGVKGGPFKYRRKFDPPEPADPTEDEYVDLESFYDLIKIYMVTLLEWCGYDRRSLSKKG